MAAYLPRVESSLIGLNATHKVRWFVFGLIKSSLIGLTKFADWSLRNLRKHLARNGNRENRCRYEKKYEIDDYLRRPLREYRASAKSSHSLLLRREYGIHVAVIIPVSPRARPQRV